MQKLFSTLLLLTACTLFSGTGALYAQTFETDGNADISAEVFAEISITNLADINFGLINANFDSDQPLLDPTDADSDANVQEGGTPISVGKFEIDANSEETLIFTFGSATLGGPGSDELSFSPTVQGSQGDATANDGDRGGDTLLSSNDTVTLTGSSYTLWVGGELGLETGEFPIDVGEYSGEFTITVDYDL